MCKHFRYAYTITHNEQIPYQNKMENYIVRSEHIIIEYRHLFLKTYSVKIEQSFKISQGKIKLKAT
jgi:hypothetical protein